MLIVRTLEGHPSLDKKGSLRAPAKKLPFHWGHWGRKEKRDGDRPMNCLFTKVRIPNQPVPVDWSGRSGRTGKSG